MEAAAVDLREFEVGKSVYYVKDGSTVCRGKIISKGVDSYRLKGLGSPIARYKLFYSADEARAAIVPESWWRGNNGH